MEALLCTLRLNNWSVAIHNDYFIGGVRMTFWLLTHPSGLFVKGEGTTDEDALRECDKQARKIFRPSP